MKRNPFGVTLSFIATGAVVLAACGDKNTASGTSPAPSSPPAKAACPGKPMLSASGSTAQEIAMGRFIKAYEQACPGHSLNYTANGSGAGILDFIGNHTDFGGSDSALNKDEHLKAEQRCGSPVWNLPMVFGPIAVAYNINGVKSLTLDGPTAAKIFNGAITTWNDPAIASLNAGVALPATPIRVVFRSDESGTTDNFQRYLDTASNGAWDRGAGKAFKGDVGDGALGNDGTAAAIKRTEGSIGYVEWSFAESQQLGVAKVITSAGPEAVPISADSVGKTISAAWFVGEDNDLAFDTISFYRPNQVGAYPIVLATYEVVCSKYPDPQVGAAVKAFLQSTIGAGQDGLTETGYIPVPAEYKARLSKAVDAIA